jgi:hypothetical protein
VHFDLLAEAVSQLGKTALLFQSARLLRATYRNAEFGYENQIGKREAG